MRILLALDDSLEAPRQALHIARQEGAELTVLFARDVTWNLFLGHDWLLGSNARADFMEWMRSEEGKAADSTLSRFRELAHNTPYTEKVVEGDVQKEILKEAATGYDLLVLPNPFYRGLERVRKAVPAIVEVAPCDILLVNRKTTE